MSFIVFDELIIIVVLSLVVLGPQRTFKMAFAIGGIFSKARAYLNSVKTQMGLDELDQVKSSLKANDFSSALKVSSPKPITKTDPKQRLWTVDVNEFSKITSTQSNENSDKDSDLERRISSLEAEIAALKQQIATK